MGAPIEVEDELLECEACGSARPALENGMCGPCNQVVLLLNAVEVAQLRNLLGLGALRGQEAAAMLLAALTRVEDDRPSVTRAATMLRSTARELRRLPFEFKSVLRPMFGQVGHTPTVEPATLEIEATFIERQYQATIQRLDQVQR